MPFLLQFKIINFANLNFSIINQNTEHKISDVRPMPK